MVELDEQAHLLEYVHIDDEVDEVVVELEPLPVEVEDEVERLVEVVEVRFVGNETIDEVVGLVDEVDEVELALPDITDELVYDEVDEIENVVVYLEVVYGMLEVDELVVMPLVLTPPADVGVETIDEVEIDDNIAVVQVVAEVLDLSECL